MKRRGGIWNSYPGMIPLRILAALLPRPVSLALAVHPWAAFLVDFMYLPRWRAEWVAIEGTIPKPPFVVTGTHEGNWEMGGAALAGHVPLTVVVQDHPDRRLLDFREKTRGQFGIETIVDRGPVFPRLLSALRRGRAVALLVDRDPRARTSAAILARRADCPLLHASVSPLPRGRYCLRFP